MILFRFHERNPYFTLLLFCMSPVSSVYQAASRLTCQLATRPTGWVKRGPEERRLIGHKLDTGWQGRLGCIQRLDEVTAFHLIESHSRQFIPLRSVAARHTELIIEQNLDLSVPATEHQGGWEFFIHTKG